MTQPDPSRRLGEGPLDFSALAFALVEILVFVMCAASWVPWSSGGRVPPRRVLGIRRHLPLPKSDNSARCCQVCTSLIGPRPSLASRAVRRYAN